jgi:hypothetical protein
LLVQPPPTALEFPTILADGNVAVTSIIAKIDLIEIATLLVCDNDACGIHDTVTHRRSSALLLVVVVLLPPIMLLAEEGPAVRGGMVVDENEVQCFQFTISVVLFALKVYVHRSCFSLGDLKSSNQPKTCQSKI